MENLSNLHIFFNPQKEVLLSTPLNKKRETFHLKGSTKKIVEKP